MEGLGVTVEARKGLLELKAMVLASCLIWKQEVRIGRPRRVLLDVRIDFAVWTTLTVDLGECLRDARRVFYVDIVQLLEVVRESAGIYGR